MRLLYLIALLLITPCLRAETRPNFVFIITDDISPNDLSVYGNPDVRTPNLEKIAAQGLVFDNAYLTISSCSPSRCSIITGRYPHNTGAQALLTIKPQPVEMLFNVKSDPYQFYNLATSPEHSATLERLRRLLGRWQEETGDNVPENPTPDRQSLHDGQSGKTQRGELPGEAREAIKINAPGPIVTSA